MKPICPSCEGTIPESELMEDTGVFECPFCGSRHRVELLFHDQRLPQPSQSKVAYQRDESSLRAVIPPLGMTLSTTALFVFACIWNYFMALMVSSDWSSASVAQIILGFIFALFGFVLLVFFAAYAFGKTEIAFDRERLTVVWSLMGMRRQRSVAVSAITTIQPNIFHGSYSNDSPFRLIHVKCAPDKPIKFGSTLDAADWRWLLAELIDFKRQVTPPEVRI